jgi:hypothetical protein
LSADELVMPQRPLRIECLARQLGDQLLQFPRAALAGQADADEVAVQIEVLVLLPPGAGGVLDHAGPELEERQQVLLQDIAQARLVARPVDDDDADDHHQVARRVHAQPRRVDRRHAFAMGHLFLQVGQPRRSGGRAGCGVLASLAMPPHS